MKRKFFTCSLILLTTIGLLGCSDSNKFNVTSKKGTTYITIPATLNPSDELPKILQDAGFIEAETNSDNSKTYSISDNDYEAFINETKASIDEYIAEINNSTDISSIDEIKIDEKMHNITANINTDSYKTSDDELVINALALKVLHYKAYTGDSLSVKIKLIDSSTKEVYDTMTIEQ